MKKLLKKYTYPFFETICLLDGRVQLIELHQRRVNHVFNYFYPHRQPIQLSHFIPKDAQDLRGKYRCRIDYNDKEAVLKMTPYTSKVIDSFVLVESDVCYPFKYTDRACLNTLNAELDPKQEALITRHGRLREASYGNIVLKLNGHWVTPMYPIFYGVMRHQLVSTGLVKEADLFVEDFEASEEVRLINAMNGLPI